MNAEQLKIKKEFHYLRAQLPNPSDYGKWYPATMTTGRKVEIRMLLGKGRNSGQPYLHIRYPIKMNLKSPNGETLNTWIEYSHFRIRARDWTVEEI